MDFPYGIVQSKNDFYLKGDVKYIRQTNYNEMAQPDSFISYDFNRNGLIEKIENRGNGGTSTRTFIKNKKLEIIHIFHGSYGDKNHSTIIEPIEYDESERVIKFKSRRIERNGLLETINPLEITVIRYGKNSQEHKLYVKNNNSIELSSTQSIEFDTDGFITKLCLTWKKVPACEAGDTREFSRSGPTHYRSILGHKTEFTYENNFISKELTTNSENIITLTTYYDYKIDNCGNWIERKLKSYNPNYSLEKREIEYFNEC